MASGFVLICLSESIYMEAGVCLTEFFSKPLFLKHAFHRDTLLQLSLGQTWRLRSTNHEDYFQQLEQIFFCQEGE